MYPALAVVDSLGSRADVLWLGRSGGLEADLVRRAGIRLETVPAAGLHGVGPRSLPSNLAALARGVVAARRILRGFRPQAMLLTGGYVGIPAALAGRSVPQALVVPDIQPGMAARLMARRARVIAVPAEDARAYYPRRAPVVVTGYPTRSDLASVEREPARSRFDIPTEGRAVLVLGGSLGAHSINRAVWSSLGELAEAAWLIHLTGEADFPQAQAARTSLDPSLQARYLPFAYLHREMGAAYAAADLVVGRAGASTLGELPLFGLPGILVPYPHAWRYQKVNADYLAKRGAALVLADESLLSELAPTVLALLSDPGRLAAMSTAARRQASPGAAGRIADLIQDLAQAGRAP